MRLKQAQQFSRLNFCYPRWIPTTLKLIVTVEQNVGPSALIINDKIWQTSSQKLMANSPAPNNIQLLIVLTERHIFRFNDTTLA